MRKLLSIAMISLALVSCDKPKNTIAPVGDSVQVVYTPELKSVYEEAKTLSPTDRAIVYKQFIGISEYIKNSKIDRSGRLDSIFTKFQGDYGYSRETYPRFTDSVSAYLIANKYDNNVSFTTREARVTTAKIFEDMSEAVKKADKEKAKEN